MAQPETPNDALIDAVVRLTEEVRVLRQTIDELREDFQCAVTNGRARYEPAEPPLQIVSMPLDPTARDFGQRINSVPNEVVQSLREEVVNEKFFGSPRHTSELSRTGKWETNGSS